MKHLLKIVAASSASFLIALNAAEISPSPAPLIRAHAHNDYEHARPLLDALDQGFCSVEADIYLIEGKLLVAHDRDKVRPDRTLQSLYLDPLRDRIRRHGGRVYPGGPTVTLLIDIKTEAQSTYAALRTVLASYAAILTQFTETRTEPKAVSVIISGNRPREILAGETTRWAALDGRLDDLNGTASPHLIPWISDNWILAFKWRGAGPLPEDEKSRLRELVSKAHQQGRRIRFWGAPDRVAVWQEFFTAGVDLINTDNLTGLRDFLRSFP